jgi:hypothetical protein
VKRGYAALFALSLVCAMLRPAAAVAAEKVALFPFEILVEAFDPEQIPIAKPAEKQRLVLLDKELTELLVGSGQYQTVDLAPFAAEIKKEAPFFKCNACEVEIAKKAQADLAVTGLVQKANENMMNISVFVRDTKTGDVVRSMAASIFQNTDDGWVRGLRRVVKDRFLGNGGKG